MSPLIEKLTQAQHPVALIRYKNRGDLQDALARGVVLLKFTGTQGGTELAVQVDPRLDSVDAGIDAASGKFELGGSLTLDYQSVTCHASIDLDSMTGVGALAVVEAA